MIIYTTQLLLRYFQGTSATRSKGTTRINKIIWELVWGRQDLVQKSPGSKGLMLHSTVFISSDNTYINPQEVRQPWNSDSGLWRTRSSLQFHFKLAPYLGQSCFISLSVFRKTEWSCSCLTPCLPYLFQSYTRVSLQTSLPHFKHWLIILLRKEHFSGQWWATELCR